MNFPRFPPWLEFGVLQTGTNAKFTISLVFTLVATPICDGFSVQKIGSVTPSGKIMKCQLNTMESAAAETDCFHAAACLSSQ